jgi:putative transposase
MPRALRVEYAGAIYHVMNRGDHGEEVFREDRDREKFLLTLKQACEKTQWQVHAYCLMRNHFHVVLETPQPNLVVGMKWMLGTYTLRFNARHRLRGHLFAGRYKALLVDESDDFYLRTVCDYVHLNPVRARMIPADVPMETYRWSSYPLYLLAPRRRPQWLRVDRLLGEHGILHDNARGRREFALRMEARRGEKEDADIMKSIRRGWRFGADDFLERLAPKMNSARPDVHAAEYLRDQRWSNARAWLDQELSKSGLNADALSRLEKGHPEKLRIANLLRQNSTLTLREIAGLLHAGNWRTLANNLSKMNK